MLSGGFVLFVLQPCTPFGCMGVWRTKSHGSSPEVEFWGSVLPALLFDLMMAFFYFFIFMLEISWCYKAPSSVAFFTWLVALGKTLALYNLRKKRVLLINWCCMCKKSRESFVHKWLSLWCIRKDRKISHLSVVNDFSLCLMNKKEQGLSWNSICSNASYVWMVAHYNLASLLLYISWTCALLAWS